MTPWLDDGDVRLYHGDCLEVLRELPDRSVHMCATSPPFYGLRNYGVDGQIGLEETPDLWVARLVDVFREVRRVLRDDGTLWVEIGDSYSAGGLGPGADGAKQGTNAGSLLPTAKKPPPGYKPKDLIGQPWLLAFALRADGWYLRSEIIWARPNPMPESVTDRPTKSHSTVFLLSKRPSYFFDQDAIREPFTGREWWNEPRTEPGNPDRKDGGGLQGRPPRVATLDGSEGEAPRGPDGRRQTTVTKGSNSEQHRDGERWPNPSGANARSVWTIPTEPTPFAHFATWPQALVRRMILAGTSERGCCHECGAPWVRQTETTYENGGAGGAAGGRGDSSEYVGKHGSRTTEMFAARRTRIDTTLGWSPSCDHIEVCEACRGVEAWADASCMSCNGEGVIPVSPVPCTVLDPFSGSATTSLVARNHGRHSIGIELNQAYLEIAAKRLQQLSLLTGETA